MSNNVNVYILAGGKSSRMGEEKGMVKFKGKTLISYVVETATRITNSICIVSNNEDYKSLNLPMLSDHFSDIGPAGGIDAALNHSTSDKNLVVSCDMPFVDSFSMNELLLQSHSFDIVMPRYKNQIEPLFALYHKQCAEQWRLLVSQGIYKLQDLANHFAVNYIDGEKLLKYNDKLFVNLNDKSSLEQFEDA